MATFCHPQETGCWNKPHLRGHLSVGSTISDSILRFEKLPCFFPTPNTQLSPPHRDQLHVLVAAPNQLVQSRKTHLPRDAMQEDHGSLDDPQKHMPSTETGYHGFSPIHFLCLPSSTSPDHNSIKQQLNKGLKSVCQVPLKQKEKRIEKNTSHGLI